MRSFSPPKSYGSPSTITRSARLPGAMVPVVSARPSSRAAEEVVAVLGDVHLDLVGALVGFDVDIGFEQAGVPYFRGCGDGDLDVGAEGEGTAEIILDIFLERGLCRGGLLCVRK